MSKVFQALERAQKERVAPKQHVEEEQATRVSGQPEVRQFSPSRGEQLAKLQRPRADQFDQPTATEILGNIDSRLVSLHSPAAIEAEQYRTICYTLEQLTKESGLSVLAVSSPSVGDGKTTTAINLAGTLAQFPGTKVLLIDMDFRRPSIAQLLGLSTADRPDVGEVIRDPRLSWSSAVRYCSPFNLYVLPARQCATAPHEMLKSQQLGGLLEETRHCYDHVIIDTPPLTSCSDCQILSRWIDGFLVVVAAHKTSRKLIEEAIAAIEQTKMVGLIFNNEPHSARAYYSSYPYGRPREPRVGWLRRTAMRLRSSSRRPSRKL